MKIFFTGDEIKFILAAVVVSAIVGGSLMGFLVGGSKFVEWLEKDIDDCKEDTNEVDENKERK